jgi:nitroreductase
MTGKFGAEANRILDQVIGERRSIRKFTDAIPPREDIEQIIKAGILAPYAGMTGKQLSDIRRFTVVTKNTGTMAAAHEIMMSEMKRNARKLKVLTKIVPYLRKNGTTFAKVVEAIAANGIPAFKTAPYFIVVGERKGFPPVEKQSLAYVMENMWLKSTVLGLGFQLLSATQAMAKNKAFMKLVGIPCGEFEIDGCVIGYPDQVPAGRREIPVDKLTLWLS